MSSFPRHAGAAVAPPLTFEQLFAAEYSRVVAIAHQALRDAHEAEDVAQDVFIAFHRRHRAGSAYAPAWLHAAAAHTALNVIRARKRRATREARYSSESTVVSDPLIEVEANEQAQHIRDALSRIERRHATVLALRYSGLSYAEVAGAMGVRISSVGTMLSRAEATLRKEIGDAPH